MGCCVSNADDGKDLDNIDDEAGSNGRRTARHKQQAAAPGGKQSPYVAARRDGDDGTDEVDMDAEVERSRRKPAAAPSSPGGSGPAVASAAAANESASSSDDDSSEEPPKPAPKPAMRHDPNSLAQTQEELEAVRAERAKAKEEAGVRDAKAIEIVFSDDDDDDEIANAGGEVAEVMAFDAGVAPSPRSDNSSNSSMAAVPTAAWFGERSVHPPSAVVWYQTPDSVHVEIAPANEDTGYDFVGRRKLLYHCEDPCETELRRAAACLSGEQGENDVILYTTSITSQVTVRDRCRGMERILFLHELQYHAMDVSDNKFMRKTLVDLCGGVDKGLPLLFVGSRYIGTHDEVQDMIDEGTFLNTLGPHVGKMKEDDAFGTEQSTVPVAYRVDLTLFDELVDERLELQRDGATGKMKLVFSATKATQKYWSQLIRGSRAEVSKLEWIRKDMAREVDDDDDDLDE